MIDENISTNIDLNDAWYRISVKALIYDKNWDILLCKEENWVWDLPGGWLDHWEDAEVCLKREIKEEMWLEVISIQKAPVCFVTANKWLSKARPWIANMCYKIEVKNLDFIASDECIEINFFNKKTINWLKTLQNVERVFEKVF